MFVRPVGVVLFFLVSIAMAAQTAHAQDVGTFRWHLYPYCNVVTFTVEQRGGAYLLTGSDDQCGSGMPSPALGTAAPNVDGTVGIGFSVVSPSATISNIKATVDLTAFSGTWQDQDANGGAFVFNPGVVGGAPRPAPRVQITAGQIGAGAVTPDTLALSVFAGSGVATTAARSDHLHDGRYHTRPEAAAAFLARTEVGPGGPVIARTEVGPGGLLIGRTELGPRGLLGQAEVRFDGSVVQQRTSTGEAVTVGHTTTGFYTVTFPGFGGGSFDHMVSVTPSGVFPLSGWRTCGVNNRAMSGADLRVTVTCVDSAAAGADATFFILVTG